MKFLIYIILFIQLFIILVYSQNNNNNNDNKNQKPILKFNKDKKFKIVQFTDLHYGDGGEKDFQTHRMQENVIEKEQPDFVMFSGDMISGYLSNFRGDLKTYDYYWNLFTKPLVSRNIPWAITMGNHDAQGPLNAMELISKDQQYNLSLTISTSITNTFTNSNLIHGSANYYLKIYSSNFQGNDKVELPLSEQDKYISSFIYVFDSDTIGCNKLDWGCIHNDQIEWFKNASINNKKKNSISFVHIPPIQIIDLWNHHHQNVVGDFNEKSCCFNNKISNFVEALLESGDVKGLYFGHDHKNDFHGNYKGMDMGYGRKSGAGSYSSGKPLGARVLLISEDPYTIETWIREEDGNKLIQTKPLKKHHYSYGCSLKDSNVLLIHIYTYITLLHLLTYLKQSPTFIEYNTNQIILLILLSVIVFVVLSIMLLLTSFAIDKILMERRKKKKETDCKNSYNE